MQATIKNFRTIGETSIEINPIALICGLNGAGKTSIARAVAAAATGKPVPYEKVTKKDSGKLLLRHGTHSGSVTLGGDKGTIEIQWPKGDVASTGTPPAASDIACGLVDLLAMKEKDALSYLIKLLKAEPSIEDLKSEIDAEQIDIKLAEAIWQVIEAQGWEAAHKRAVETGQQRKGAWSQITGTAWGDEKAREWYPEGWEDNMAEISSEQLQIAVNKAKAKVEAEIAKNAVSQSEREKLQALVDKIPELKELFFTKTQAAVKAQGMLDELIKELSTTPNPHAKEEYKCPHCENPLQINQTTPGKFTLTKAESIRGDTKKASLKYAELCGKKSKLEGENTAAINAVNIAGSELKQAEDAEKKLVDMPDVKEGSADALTFARVDLAAAEHKLSLVNKCSSAQAAMQQVVTNQKLVKMLSETGLRKKKLADCLDAFIASYIDPLCNDFGIPVATIDTDLNIDVGTTSYAMLSESEQFRVRTVFQLAIAKLENASLVIIDRADILDKNGRTRLFTTIINAGIPALICMTLNNPDQAPNLSGNGYGISYWIEKGSCRPIMAKKEAA